jgi:ferric-dicitrate binding protein FerR (iron transport regulator)
VWLNAASGITYPTAFTGNNRKVTIRGEAYFEVAKNKAMPFIVDVDGKATVEVLGTHFNINAYADEQSINTTLLEGSVKVESAAGSRQPAMLKPGHQAQINQRNPDKIQVISDTDVEMVMAWRNGSFRFNRAHLDEVLRQLSRWYDIDVSYQQGVPAILISGEIKRDLNLTQALMILDKMGVHSRIEGRKLMIMP